MTPTLSSHVKKLQLQKYTENQSFNELTGRKTQRITVKELLFVAASSPRCPLKDVKLTANAKS